MLTRSPAGASSSTRTVTVIETVAPTATGASGQVMSPAAAVQPAEALTNVVCAGRASVTDAGARGMRAVALDLDRVREQIAWGRLGVIDHLREAQVVVRGGERGDGQKASHGNQQHEHAAHRAPRNQVHRRLLVSLVQFPPGRDLAEPSNPSIGGRRGNPRTSGGSSKSGRASGRIRQTFNNPGRISWAGRCNPPSS